MSYLKDELTIFLNILNNELNHTLIIFCLSPDFYCILCFDYLAQEHYLILWCFVQITVGDHETIQFVFRGMQPAEAELNYLDNACKLSLYGVHMFRAKVLALFCH